MSRQDIMYVFDQLRTDVFDKFNDVLKLANTKEELDAVHSKMKQVEQEISSRIKPFEKKNKTVSQQHLERLDEAAFQTI